MQSVSKHILFTLAASASLSLLSNCTGKNFNGDSKSTNAPETTTSTQGNGHEPEKVVEDERVAPPSKIIGSWMDCEGSRTDAHNLICSVFDSMKSPSTISPQRAFVRKANATTWVEVSFTQTSLGVYSLAIPQDFSSDFTVGMNFGEDNGSLYDWFGTGMSLANIVRDGSFEDNVLPEVPVLKYLNESEWTAWQGLKSQTSTCLEAPVIEIQHPNQTWLNYPSYEGVNRLDLDSGCTQMGTETQGQNTIVYQDIPVVANNLYFVRFAYAQPPYNVQRSFLQAKVDEETLYDAEVTAGWTVFKKVVRAKTSILRISFEDKGEEDLAGVIIDAVNIIPIPEL